MLRAQTLSLRNRDYVAAARVSGERTWRVICVEILPNLLPIVASQFVFAVVLAILSEAGLSFLGLGAADSSTLGTMLYYAQNGFALQREAWWWFVPPGLVIALLGARWRSSTSASTKSSTHGCATVPAAGGTWSRPRRRSCGRNRTRC